MPLEKDAQTATYLFASVNVGTRKWGIAKIVLPNFYQSNSQWEKQGHRNPRVV